MPDIIFNVLSSKRSPGETLRYCYKKRSKRGFVGRVEGCLTGDVNNDAVSLVARHHPGKPGVKHIVASCDKFSDRNACFHALFAVAEPFVDHFAPGADYVLVPHDDTPHPHAHLVVCNSNGVRCWDWKRNHLQAMQELVWLPMKERYRLDLHPGKGKGIGRGSTNHAVRKLAKHLVEKYPDLHMLRALKDKVLQIDEDPAFNGTTLFRFNKCRVAASVLERTIEYVRVEKDLLSPSQGRGTEIVEFAQRAAEAAAALYAAASRSQEIDMEID